jgi:hypothetical protein
MNVKFNNLDINLIGNQKMMELFKESLMKNKNLKNLEICFPQ